MADYSFLFEKTKEQAFIERCAAAALVLASAIVADPAATDLEKAWAIKAFGGPVSVGRQAAAIVIGANATELASTIDGATDIQIQAAVDAAKAVLVAG